MRDFLISLYVFLFGGIGSIERTINLFPLRYIRPLSHNRSFSVEAKEKLVTTDSKCWSLVEAYHLSVIAKSNGCLHFEATVESNCFSTVETKEKFSSTVLNCRSLVDAEHSSDAFVLLKGGRG